ncbi:22710_t:CDS:2, partial [Racocetra persica]
MFSEQQKKQIYEILTNLPAKEEIIYYPRVSSDYVLKKFYEEFKVIKLNNMKKKKLLPVHPGEILREELLIPLQITPEELAKEIEFPLEKIQEICKERENITPDLAARLAIFFDSTAQFWMNMQRSYEEKLLADKLAELRKSLANELELPPKSNWKNIEKVLRRKLKILLDAEKWQDLQIFPNNKPEKLR